METKFESSDKLTKATIKLTLHMNAAKEFIDRLAHLMNNPEFDSIREEEDE